MSRVTTYKCDVAAKAMGQQVGDWIRGCSEVRGWWSERAAPLLWLAEEVAVWRCQRCSKQCRKPSVPIETHKRTLTAAYLDHDPRNCELSYLRALCALCHLRYDVPRKAEERKRKNRDKS